MPIQRRLFLTVLGLGTIFAVTLSMLLLWFAGRIDTLAGVEARLRVETAFARDLAGLETLVTDYAFWEAPLDWLRSGDEAALYANFGSGATESDAFDFLYIVESDGTPARAYVNGGAGSDLAGYRPEVAVLLPLVRAHPPEDFVAISGLLALGDGTAMIAAARLTPDDTSITPEADLPVVIGGRMIRAGNFAGLVSEGPVALVREPPAPDAADSALPLAGLDGAPAGALIWPAPAPGGRLLAQTAPVLGCLAVVIVAGGWFVARLSARQADDYLREHYRARTDPGTGLLNRNGLRDLMQEGRMRAALANGRVAVLYIDLDGIKSLNDTFGHRVGDAAIATTAQRLTASVRRGDGIARVGGDEFVCILVDDRPEAAALAVAQRFRALCGEDFTCMGQSHRAVASVGLAVSEPGLDWEALIGRADQAMYVSKREARAEVVRFDQPMRSAG